MSERPSAQAIRSFSVERFPNAKVFAAPLVDRDELAAQWKAWEKAPGSGKWMRVLRVEGKKVWFGVVNEPA